MITGVVEYVIDPAQAKAFERFARRWMELVVRRPPRPADASGRRAGRQRATSRTPA
jgi:hypothetical protein